MHLGRSTLDLRDRREHVKFWEGVNESWESEETSHYSLVVTESEREGKLREEEGGKEGRDVQEESETCDGRNGSVEWCLREAIETSFHKH